LTIIGDKGRVAISEILEKQPYTIKEQQNKTSYKGGKKKELKKYHR
jgi:hypothetical protein